MEQPTQKRRRWQFTILSLLFVMFCLSGLLGGYRIGYHYGLERRKDEAQYAVVYSIEGLAPVDPQSNLSNESQLIQLICQTIAADTWQVVGGMASVSAPSNNPNMLIVSQTRENHEAIADLLEQMRAVNQRLQSPPAEAK